MGSDDGQKLLEVESGGKDEQNNLSDATQKAANSPSKGRPTLWRRLSSLPPFASCAACASSVPSPWQVWSWFAAMPVSSSLAELVRPSATLSPRSLKFLLGCQLLAVALLFAALVTVHVELAVLQDTASAPLAKGGQKEILRRLCKDSSLAKELHGKFKNVVLIVNVNYESVARSTSEFVRAVYGRFFDNIVIVSESDVPELGVEARGQHMWRGQWYYAFWHLPKVIADYPDADGFLWTNDDVAINYWQLSNGNLSKLWLTNDPNHPESKYFPFDLKAKAKWSDWAAEEDNRKKAGEAYIAMELKYRNQFDKSVSPLDGTFPKRIVDLFYIPKRFSKALAFDLIPIYREFKLWSEVALPMIFYALDAPKDWDHVLDDMKYSWGHWDKTKVFDPTEHWQANVSAFHPWKLSNPTLRAQLVMAYSNTDPCILQLLQESYVHNK